MISKFEGGKHHFLGIPIDKFVCFLSKNVFLGLLNFLRNHGSKSNSREPNNSYLSNRYHVYHITLLISFLLNVFTCSWLVPLKKSGYLVYEIFSFFF